MTRARCTRIFFAIAITASSMVLSLGLPALTQTRNARASVVRGDNSATVVVLWSSVAKVHTKTGKTLGLQIGPVGYTGHCCSLTVGLTTSSSSPVYWQDIGGGGLTSIFDDWCIGGGICWLAQTGANPINGRAIPIGESHDWTFPVRMMAPPLGRWTASEATGSAIQPFGLLNFSFAPATSFARCGGRFHTGKFSVTLNFKTQSRTWGTVNIRHKLTFPKGTWEMVFPSGCQDSQGSVPPPPGYYSPSPPRPNSAPAVSPG
jgi:hypothetical protein